MSRSDLEDVMWEAWNRVWPQLKGDADELRARVARRRSRMYLRPLRAMCLAVRASDQRINSWDAACVPEDACYPGRRDLYREHTVWVDQRLLLRVCSPVRVDRWGETAKELASRLGYDQSNVRCLRKAGKVRVRYRMDRTFMRPEPAAGSRMNPAIYHADAPLDPSARGKQRPDPIFGPLWAWYARCLDEDFCQTLVRVPVYCGGQPTATGPRFMGWRWVCPGCKKKVETVYLPQGSADWAGYVGVKVEESEVDEVPEPPGCFACGVCHGVVGFTRTDVTRSWNNLVLHLSGGLLYGREVRRPQWFVAGRKKRYGRHRCKRPRQDELERLLVETRMSFKEIAAAMGIRYGSVLGLTKPLYRRRGVHSREQLRDWSVAKLRGPQRSSNN